MDALAASNPVLGNYASALNYGCKSTQTCRSINIRHSQNLHYCDLSWSTGSRFINLQQGLINRYSSQLLACSPSQKDCLNLRAFTESQEALVKETWGILKKDAGRHAVNLFLRVFEIAPSTKRLFSFLKDSDVPLEKNPQLKSHALTVFVIICEASTSLRNEGKVLTPGSTMKKMAQAHGLSGVVDEHYDVVKFCLLKTIEEGLPEGKWNSEVREAWVEAYDELVAAIKAEDIAAA